MSTYHYVYFIIITFFFFLLINFLHVENCQVSCGWRTKMPGKDPFSDLAGPVWPLGTRICVALVNTLRLHSLCPRGEPRICAKRKLGDLSTAARQPAPALHITSSSSILIIYTVYNEEVKYWLVIWTHCHSINLTPPCFTLWRGYSLYLIWVGM